MSKTNGSIEGRSAYGSASLEEFEARMRQAGYEDWEINEEVDLMVQVSKDNRRNTECIRATGRMQGIEKAMSSARAAKLSEMHRPQGSSSALQHAR